MILLAIIDIPSTRFNVRTFVYFSNLSALGFINWSSLAYRKGGNLIPAASRFSISNQRQKIDGKVTQHFPQIPTLTDTFSATH